MNMNRLYRLVYNATAGVIQVVAIELTNAIGGGKPGKRRTKKRSGKAWMTPAQVAAPMALLLGLAAAPLPQISIALAATTISSMTGVNGSALYAPGTAGGPGYQIPGIGAYQLNSPNLITGGTGGTGGNGSIGTSADYNGGNGSYGGNGGNGISGNAFNAFTMNNSGTITGGAGGTGAVSYTHLTLPTIYSV